MEITPQEAAWLAEKHIEQWQYWHDSVLLGFSFGGHDTKWKQETIERLGELIKLIEEDPHVYSDLSAHSELVEWFRKWQEQHPSAALLNDVLKFSS